MINHQIPVVLFTEYPLARIDNIFNNTETIIASTQAKKIQFCSQKSISCDIKSERLLALLSDLQQRCKYYTNLKFRSDHKCICVKYQPYSVFQRDLPSLILSIKALYPEFKSVIDQERLLFIPHHADKDFVINTVYEHLGTSRPWLPIYIGHDLNDFSGFSTVKELQGMSIKSGYGKTNATYLFTDVFELFDLCEGLLAPTFVHGFEMRTERRDVSDSIDSTPISI